MEKTTVLYHGTDREFNEFKIGKEYLRKKDVHLSEGLGVYLTEKMDFGRSYGHLIYEVEVPYDKVSDFTNKDFIITILKKMRKDVKQRTGCDIFNYFDFDNFAELLSEGEYRCTTMYKEISDQIDAVAEFHERHGDLITYEDDCIHQKIKQSFLRHVGDVIKNTNINFAIPIYTCFRNPEVLKIVKIHNML